MESLFKSFVDDSTKNYWVAFSGGLDSHVLLHALATFREKFPLNLKAIHIHHGLSENADSWQKHCEKICHDLHVELKTVSIQIDSHKNIEEIARKKRYGIFQRILLPEDILFTAHHEDDQAETVLLQLFRGAGTKGLSAMPLRKKLGGGFHVRPFLSVSREALEKYGVENQLTWIEDESNQNKKFSRNFLRQDIFPLLKKQFPGVNAAITRTAKHCASIEEVLQEYVFDDFQKVFNPENKTLSLSKIKVFSEGRQIQMIRVWLRTLGFPLPSERKMREILRCLLTAAEDRFPLIQFGEVELKRYRDEIVALGNVGIMSLRDMEIIPHSRAGGNPFVVYYPLQMDSHRSLPSNALIGGNGKSWSFDSPLILPTIGTLTAEKTQGQGLNASITAVTVRFREGGERCYLRGSHRELKKLFQTWGVPPWLRFHVPLLFFEDKLIAVVGYFLDERYVVGEQEWGISVSCKEVPSSRTPPNPFLPLKKEYS